MRTKRAKWDNAGDGTAAVAPKPEHLRQKAEEAAARIVAQIKEDKAQSEDVCINDEPIAVRDQLTRRASLVYVEQQTGTSIVIKGRYYPPGSARDSINAPLHLHITPQQHLGTDKHHRRSAVARAAAHVHAILRGEATLTSPVAPYPCPQVGMAPPPDLAHMNPGWMPHMQQPYPGAHPPHHSHQHGPPPGPVQFMPPPPGMHAGLSQQPPMHHTRPGGPGMYPPPGHGLSRMNGPGDQHPSPPGQAGWQNQQNWSQQHHLPPQGAAPMHAHGSPPPGYESSRARDADMPLPHSGAFMSGSQPPDVTTHAGHPPPDPHAHRSEQAADAAALSSEPWEAAGGFDAGPDSSHVAILRVDFHVPPGFDVVGHLRGPDNSYIAHIEQETGVSIEVFEQTGHAHAACPVEVHVVTREPWKRHAAVDLVESLLDTVKVSADAWIGSPSHDAAVSDVPDHGAWEPPPDQHPGAQLPLPQFPDRSGGPPSYEEHRNSQHAGCAQPQGPPDSGYDQWHEHMPPHANLMHAGHLHRHPPPMMHDAPPRPPPNGSSAGDSRHHNAALHSDTETQLPRNGASASAYYYSKSRSQAVQQQPPEKPAKRKFREFKEEAGASQAPQEKAEDAQLPSYYKHLREGASKAPPPDIASGEADGSEPPQFGPARAAAGYAQMYGPRNDPHGERHHGQEPPDSSPYPENRPGLGARSGLGALGAAAPGSMGLVPYGDD